MWRSNKLNIAALRAMTGSISQKKFKVARPHLCGDFECHMEKLFHAAVVGRIALIVTDGGHKLFGGPPAYGFGGRQFGWIDVDDRGG